MSSTPLSPQYQRALQLFEEHNLPEAAALLETVVKDEPTNAYAFNDLGTICFYLAQDDQAVAHLTHAAELSPTDELILKNCVEVFTALGLADKSAQYQAQLSQIQLTPTDLNQIQPEPLSPAEPVPPATRGLPRITLGIPTRNRLEPLFTLLSSVQQQTYQNFELLISDDGGVENLADKIRAEYPTLSFRYLNGPGVSLPVNRAFILDNAHTEFVVMCDDDHYMDPHCLEELARTMITDDSIGIVSAIWPHPYENPPTVVFDEVKNRDDFRLDLDNIHRGGDFWWKNGCEMFKAFQREPQVFESQFAGGGCLIYRKSAVLAAGGFPTDCSVVSFREDTDLSHRVYLRGYRVLVNSKALAYHLRAETGGCKDTKEWEELFVTDGLLFLEKLERWREEKIQREALQQLVPTIRLLFFYDEKGWAWWHRAHQIKNNLSDRFAADILQLGTPFDWRQYDFIVLFDHNLVPHIPPVPAERLVIGNSCPKLLDGAIEAVRAGQCVAGFVNNYSGYQRASKEARFFCCQNGVDTTLFTPPSTAPERFVACWTGNSNSIGNKGLDLIRQACAREGIELLVVDAATKTPGTEANSQAWLRDNLYYKASVLLCASEYEGTPNPALEALACGVPVISTAVGNMPEIIVDGYNGYLVERSVDALCEALRKVRSSDQDQLRQQARTSVEYGWSWREQLKKYEAMFEALLCERQFGVMPPITVSKEEVQKTVAARMQGGKPHLQPIDAFVTDVDGKFITLDPTLCASSLETVLVERTAFALQSMRPFYLHFGGIGDAMLLLSTIPEDATGITVLSVATNIEAAKAFWGEIPQVETVCLLDFPTDSAQRLLRFLCGGLENCLGMGITSKHMNYRDWEPGVDLEETFGVNKHPAWVKQFTPNKLSPIHSTQAQNISAQITPVQITVAPRGSLSAMSAARKNQIDPALWPLLIESIVTSGYEPIILGTEREAAEYPALDGCIDKRSATLREQIELIAGSDLFIGADSWGKTYSALLGLPTIVFPPLMHGKHEKGCDASAHIFLEPWRTLTQVTSLAEFQAAFDSVTSTFEKPKRTAPTRSLRVLVLARPNAFTQRGGDTVVMEKTIEGLKSRGVRVDVDLNRDTDVASYNVVLLYNFALKELMLNDAQRCLQAGVPYVVQTMYEDWPKFFGQMTGSAQLIDHYLKLGQRRETWPQFEKVLKRIEPTGIWDNTFSATNAACLIATGHEEARVLTRDYPGANVRVIHYGQEAAPAGDGGELFFQESGLRDYVLCVGRLESRKNQHMLLKALEDSPLPLVFLGGGFSYQPEYAQVCERFKRLGDTVFLGRMSPELLASAFSGARVHALPSFYELPGLVSLEAAAYGTNIVVADYGTVRDYVGDYAFYCDPTDPQDIRRAVEAAYEAPKNPALQELVTSFSWERFYDQVLALFEEVASTGSELTEERPGC